MSIYDDELVIQMKEQLVARGYEWVKCISEEEVAQAEAQLGFALPSLLRRIYLEVGDGAFGLSPLDSEDFCSESWEYSSVVVITHPQPKMLASVFSPSLAAISHRPPESVLDPSSSGASGLLLGAHFSHISRPLHVLEEVALIPLRWLRLSQ